MISSADPSIRCLKDWMALTPPDGDENDRRPRQCPRNESAPPSGNRPFPKQPRAPPLSWRTESFAPSDRWLYLKILVVVLAGIAIYGPRYGATGFGTTTCWSPPTARPRSGRPLAHLAGTELALRLLPGEGHGRMDRVASLGRQPGAVPRDESRPSPHRRVPVLAAPGQVRIEVGVARRADLSPSTR